ncbi:hypothetical protein [Bacillus sp. AFS098217]|uniref:hypothetical protein n=1 Tax=Bacillus sp. AFS098217 TaxID=2033868 RepID=UPI00359FC686
MVKNLPQKYLIWIGIFILVLGVTIYNTIHRSIENSKSKVVEKHDKDEVEMLGDKKKGFDTKEKEYIAKTKTVEDLIRMISNNSYDVPYLFTKEGFGIEPMNMTSDERMRATEAVHAYFLKGDTFYNSKIKKIERGGKLDTFHVEFEIQQVNFIETREFKIQVNKYAQIVTPIQKIEHTEEIPVE